MTQGATISSQTSDAPFGAPGLAKCIGLSPMPMWLTDGVAGLLVSSRTDTQSTQLLQLRVRIVAETPLPTTV